MNENKERRNLRPSEFYQGFLVTLGVLATYNDKQVMSWICVILFGLLLTPFGKRFIDYN